jgi:uncharacterized membrane protein
MLFLFTIVVLPFSAAVLADYRLAAPAITLYGANVAACSATLAIAWWYAVAKRLSVDVRRDERRRVAIRTMISPTLAVVGIAVATIAPVASLVLFVAIPVASYHAETYSLNSRSLTRLGERASYSRYFEKV